MSRYRREEGGVAPRPWSARPKNKNASLFTVVDRNGDPVADDLFQADAELICAATDPAEEVRRKQLERTVRQLAFYLPESRS